MKTMVSWRMAGLAAILFGMTACAGSRETVPTTEFGVSGVPADPGEAPSAPREFRAAWVATVANIDWPSRPGLPARAQQDELRAILDQAVVMGLNAIVFQVRPMADAFYRSELEPVSWYLTGVQGQDAGYDPLDFAVEEAHRRGLELHAWFNPYRAGHPTSGAPDSLHVRIAHPDRVVQYGEQWWLDPGNDEARDHSLAVISDVVGRYDIDGIHVDDYFYPYPVQDEDGEEVPFPDSTSWIAAVAGGETRDLGDWRRSRVDAFIEEMYARTKRAKPWVKVGISPFGIWRPGHPEGVRGFDQYAKLYADARKWLREGWVDYFTPQLYWSIDSEGQPYGALLTWWEGENMKNRHLWPGNFTSRVIPAGGAVWQAGEIADQVRLTRATTDGNVHFSMRAMMPGTGVDEELVRAGYGQAALVPETDWLGGVPPGAPTVRYRTLGERGIVDVRPGAGDEPFVWHLRVEDDHGWTVRIIPAWQRSMTFEAAPRRILISAVNRLGQEGPAIRVDP